MINKISKQSYFIKRLRDSGYYVDRLIPLYGTVDPRQWTILIDPRGARILCTCYENHGEHEGIKPESLNFFEVFDGGQFIPGRLTIETSSIETFITNLMHYGIQPQNTNPKASMKRY